MHAEWIVLLEGKRLLLWLTGKFNEGIMKNSALLIMLLIIKLVHKCRLRERRGKRGVQGGERREKRTSLNYKSLILAHSRQDSSFVPLETDVQGSTLTPDWPTGNSLGIADRR